MSEIRIADITSYLEDFAPLGLAEDWDNVGLLLGDKQSNVARGLTCLTVTPDVVEEAIEVGIDLIVSHHPMPFRPLNKITTDSITGRMVLELCQNKISVYSPHTAFDSTFGGINQMIAERLGLVQIRSIKPIVGWNESDEQAEQVFGVGRMGVFAQSVSCREFGDLLAERFSVDTVKFSGDLNDRVERVGIACGSAGQFLADANRLGCDTFVTGETNFHTCLEAQAKKTSLFLLGHYGSERFAVEALAERLAIEFPGIDFSASSRESDPIQYLSRS